MIRHLFLAISLSAAAHAAAEGPSFDCAKAESSAEQLVCTDEYLSQLDRQLAARFAAALAAARGLDAGATEAEAQLRATQRGWISGRNECWKADDAKACIATAYLKRDGELVALRVVPEQADAGVGAAGLPEKILK